MKKISSKIVMAMCAILMCVFSMSLTSCGGDGDGDGGGSSSLNAYEQALVGTWIENGKDISTSTSCIVSVCNSDRTCVNYFYYNGVLSETHIGTWSATSNTVTTVYNGQTETVSYTMSNGLVYMNGLVMRKQSSGQ